MGTKSTGEEREPSIVMLHDGGQSRRIPTFRYPLGPGVDVVGRDESCSIQVLDPLVSREHVSIRFDARAGGFLASDMGSVNGTVVNGRKITGPTPLTEGDLIEVGGSRLVFTSRRFEHQADALLYFKRYGEHDKSTLRRKLDEPGAEDVVV